MPTPKRFLSLLLCGILLLSLCSPLVLAEVQAQGLGQVPGRSGEQAVSATLIIGGQEIPNTNADVFGNGTVAYNKEDGVLTLKGCRLPDKEIGYSGDPNSALTIRLEGENTLSSISVWINGGGLKISGPGSLQVQSSTSSGIHCSSKDIVISEGATVTARSGNGSGISTPANLEIRGGSTVNAFGSGSDSVLFAGITIGGDIIIKENSKVTATSDKLHGIYTERGNVTISGSKVSATSATATGCGIWAQTGSIQIDGSTVSAQGYFPGLNGNAGVIITGGSDVTANSSNDCGIFSPLDIEISGSKVSATSATTTGCGIWAQTGSIQIDGSTVSAEGYYPGLNGNTGVIITGNSDVKANSSNDCAIFSPKNVLITGSKANVLGHFAGLRGNTGVIIQEGSTVTTVSRDDCGIFSPGSIAISGSEVEAEGYYAGLQKNETDGAIKITGSKVTATATIPSAGGNGRGIYTQGGLAVDSSEVYAQGSFRGIDMEGAGTAYDAWIRAENAIGMGSGDIGTYQPEDSVTIQSGKWSVVGDARVPKGALVKAGDQIHIPQDASLFLEEGEITIFGEVSGIIVDADGALPLPAGTLLQKKGHTGLTLGASGGKILADGTLYATYGVTLHTGGGAIAADKQVTEYLYGKGASLPVAGDMVLEGFRFAGWYADGGFSGNPVTAITAEEAGDKDYYAKWEWDGTTLPDGKVGYIVEHYKGGAGGYTLAETEYATGQVGTTVSATPKSYDGYTYQAEKSTASGELKAITTADDIVTLKLYYDAILYTVTVRSEGSGKVSVSPAEGGGSYPKGTQVSLQAIPDDGWQFLRWEENGQAVSSANPYQFLVEGDRQLTAVFEQKSSGGKKLETKVDTLSTVPEGLKNTFNTVDEIIGELARQVTVQAGYTKENFAAYDVQLLIRLDGGNNWQAATEADFPAEGISVILPYPQGTGRDTHDFIVTHMFTLTSRWLGTTAGDTEQPPVEKTAEGLRVTFHGLSPVGIAWKETGQGKPITPDVGGGSGSSGSGSSGTGSPEEEADNEYSFWQQVKRQIEDAKADATIQINARDYRRMPLSVMKALYDREDVSLVIRWSGGDPITIPAGKALQEEGRIFYPLSYLASYDFGRSAAGDTEQPGKSNPGTGASEITGR